MKYFRNLLILFVLLIWCVSGAAQHRSSRELDGPRPERLEKFRKMRLIEALKLNEEDAVRFFAKQSAHETTQRDLMKSRNEALNKIEDLSGDKKGDDKDIAKLADEVMSIDQKILTERQRYQE